MELTDKQKWILELLYEGGYRWIATDKNGGANVYKNKPARYSSYWASCTGDWMVLEDIFDQKLTHWKDDEPLDIKKALGIVDWSTIPVDTKILVKDTGYQKWDKRYFAKYTDGKVYAWADGRTSWSCKAEDAIEWDEAKLYQEQEEE